MYLAIDLHSIIVDLDSALGCLAIVCSDIIMVKSCSELLDEKLRYCWVKMGVIHCYGFATWCLDVNSL